jgi:hypothetical protein
MTKFAIADKEYTLNESAVSEWALLTIAKLAQFPADFALQRQVAELLAEMVFLDADDKIAIRGATMDKWFLTLPIAALGDLVTALTDIYHAKNPEAYKKIKDTLGRNGRPMRSVESAIENSKRNRGFARK